nr:transposase [Halorhodospira halophila]
MSTTVTAVDLGKKVFEVAIADRPSAKPAHKRFSRRQFERFIAKQPAGVFVLESCGTAHYWARELARLGHSPRILPAHYVAAYRRRNKTDRADTLALLEAHRAPDIQAVSVKTPEQQGVQQLHRLREHLIKTRTAWINQVRGLLREQGKTPQRAIPVCVMTDVSSHPCYNPAISSESADFDDISVITPAMRA